MTKMKLSQIQADISAHTLGWTAEDNPITHMTVAEQDALLGYAPDPASGEMSLAVREQHASLVALAIAAEAGAESAVGAPVSVDLRSYNGHNYITPVRDQKVVDRA